MCNPLFLMPSAKTSMSVENRLSVLLPKKRVSGYCGSSIPGVLRCPLYFLGALYGKSSQSLTCVHPVPWAPMINP